MAAYDYKCPTDVCDEAKTIERSMMDAEVKPTCRRCGCTMRRVWLPTPVQFVGTGFYSTGG